MSSSSGGRQLPERGSSQAALTKDDAIEMNSMGTDEVFEGGVQNPLPKAPKKEDETETKLKWLLRKIWKKEVDEDGKLVTIEENKRPEKTGEEKLVESFRELGIYMGYVVILCIMSFGITNPTTYYFTKTMRDLFSDGPGFEDLTTMKDFWRYTESVLMDALYWDKFYNDMEVPEEKQGYILMANRLLGSPRFRQLRISNASCTIPKDFAGEVKECFSVYSKSMENREAYGLMNGSAWNYQSEYELKGKDVWGHVANYDGGGYVELLGVSRENASKRIAVLKENLWLDRATRAVFIEFSVYNPNINLFCLVTLIFEFPATGGLLPMAQIRTLKLLRYVSNMDFIVLCCEGLFFLYLLYYTIEEVLEIRIQGPSYFGLDMWNYFDLVLMAFGYITLFFIFYVYFEVKEILSALLATGGEGYANFNELGKRQELFNQFSAIFVFLAWIKIFKFMTFNKTMMQLQKTLQDCAKDIAGFSVMFFIIFMAYAQWGYLIFGTQVYDFSSYQRCMYTLFRIILGDFDFGAIEQANRIMGPVFFITYVLLVFFVLINMFLAIITDTYTNVKEELAHAGLEFNFGDYFMKGYGQIKEKIKAKRANNADIQDAIQNADMDGDKAINFDEWKAELKSRGHEDDEIEAVFSRYDLDGDRVLNMNEILQMNEQMAKEQEELNEEMDEMGDIEEEMRDLDSRLSSMSCVDEDMKSIFDPSDSEEEEVPMADIEDFLDVRDRVDHVEKQIGSIAHKIDTLLTKIDAIDTAKFKRRRTLNLLLESLTAETENRGKQMEMLRYTDESDYESEYEDEYESGEYTPNASPSASPKTKKKEL